MPRPELPLLFALLLFGPSLLALAAGLGFLLWARPSVSGSAACWPVDVLDYEPAPPSTQDARTGRLLLGAACVLPTALFLLCLTALMHARLSLGHWPRPMLDAVTPLAMLAAACNGAYVLIQFLLVPAMITLAYLMRRTRLAGISLLLYGAASLASLAFVWFSPLAPWVIGD